MSYIPRGVRAPLSTEAPIEQSLNPHSGDPTATFSNPLFEQTYAAPPAKAAAASPPIDQDVPTIYFEVTRPGYTEFHNTLLQCILAARLHVDVLTSDYGYMGLHLHDTYTEAEADMLARGAALDAVAAVALQCASGFPTLCLPGAGPIFVRITAPEARLLEEAERAEFKLPLNAHVLRCVDIERNREERYPGQGAAMPPERLSIPSVFNGSGLYSRSHWGMDPYEYHFGPYVQKKSLPQCTKAALQAAGFNPGMRLDDPRFSRILYAPRGPDGKGLLSELSSLKLILSILTAPNAPDEEGEWQGANLELAQLTASGKVVSVFAGHSYAAREAAMAASASASWDLRSFGIGSLFFLLATQVQKNSDLVVSSVSSSLGGGSSSTPRLAAPAGAGAAAAGAAAAQRPSPPSAPPPKAAISAREHRARVLLTSMTGVAPGAPPELDSYGSARFIRPSEYIRAYFGESIGMYFAFSEFYQSTMAFISLMGIGVFVYQRYLDQVEVNVLPLYALLAALWSMLFQLTWRRRQSMTVLRWGMTDFSAKEALRPAYTQARHTAKGRGPVDGRITWEARRSVQSYRATVSCCVTSLAMLGCILVCFLVFYGRLLLSGVLTSSGDYLMALINNMWIGLGNSLWALVAGALTAWENKPTASAYSVSFVFKSSLFRILNTYVSLFYIALQIKNFVRLGAESDQCALRYNGQLATPAQLAEAAAGRLPPPTSDCITELYEQLTIQMAANWFCCVAFVHLVDPALQAVAWARLRLTGLSPRGVDAPTLQRAAAAVEAASAAVAQGEPNQCSSPQELWLRLLAESNSGFLNFVECYMTTLLQFGYVALFSPSFPLAGTVAVISNAAGVRIDTWKIFRYAKRPIPEGAQDIGAWATLFMFVSCLAVLTNSAVISITTTQPLFTLQEGFLSQSSLKLVWFIFSETLVLSIMGIVLVFVSTATPEATLQQQRGKYLVRKILGGVMDKPETAKDDFVEAVHMRELEGEVEQRTAQYREED